MKPFFISVAFAVVQVLLLKRLLGALTVGYKGKAAVIFIVKFVLYAVAIALLMFKFFKYYMFCLCGFAAGMPMTAIILFVYSSFFKGKINFKKIKKIFSRR